MVGTIVKIASPVGVKPDIDESTIKLVQEPRTNNKTKDNKPKDTHVVAVEQKKRKNRVSSTCQKCGHQETHNISEGVKNFKELMAASFYIKNLMLFTAMTFIFFMFLLAAYPGRVFTGPNPQVILMKEKTKSFTWPDPPPHENLAEVARYVMHISEWCSLSTNSTHEGIEGYPFVNVFSVSDGPVWNSTGVPYFYLTPMELSVKDLEANNKASLTLSEAQSDYCSEKGYDPEDPRCAHIILTGTIVKIEKGTEEEHFAKLALFSRHEEMAEWPTDHDWFFAKMEIIHIYVLDYFGGVGVVSIEDYYASNPFK